VSFIRYDLLLVDLGALSLLELKEFLVQNITIGINSFIYLDFFFFVLGFADFFGFPIILGLADFFAFVDFFSFVDFFDFPVRMKT
jgi:hypothetical protein